ncbi:MAG: hypothetical protein MJZ67_08105 [Bacteroidales bacterium]|nr:hypothetical protein [Bacteroidales bacterium]
MKKIYLMAMLCMLASSAVNAQSQPIASRSAVADTIPESLPEMWPVTGADNLGFKHRVSYGNFTTSYATLVESETIKSHLFYATWRKEATIKFKQQLGDMAVKVKVKQNLNNDEFAKIMKLFSLNVDKGLDYAVDINHPQSGVWHMACNTSFADQDFDCGVLYADSGKAYTIRGRNYSTSKDVMFLRTRFYYTIFDGDKRVAAVDSDGKGWAWIDTSLPAEQQIVLAAASTSLLMLKWLVVE